MSSVTARAPAKVNLALRVKDGGFTSYPITQDVTFSGDPDFDYLEQWVDASIEDSMTQDAPESVLGETEPGSTAPAETGTAPNEEEQTPGPDEGSASAEDTEDAPSEEPSSDAEASTAEESADPGAGEESSPTPEIEKDPLKSCLPGYEE